MPNKKYAGPSPQDSVPSSEFLNATLSKTHKAALDGMAKPKTFIGRTHGKNSKIKTKKAYQE